jgi:hypothetical protein
MLFYVAFNGLVFENILDPKAVNLYGMILGKATLFYLLVLSNSKISSWMLYFFQS